MTLSNDTDGAGNAAVSRRGFLKQAGVSGLAAAAAPLSRAGDARAAGADGTPEQIHLTWGEDPSAAVVVSWASPGPARHPRVSFGESVAAMTRSAAAEQRTYTDGLTGETVYTYHARLEPLEAASTVHYSITADNDRNAQRPFSASFQTAPRGRSPFRFTSYGDLATPETRWNLSSPQSRHAVQAVERFKPLFHLLNGDLCYANLNPHFQPAVWRGFGMNNQASAAHRPWMPCLGNHEVEFNNGPQGFDSYLTRYTLPDNHSAFRGRWYSFRVAAALFVALDANDVTYQDAAAFVTGPDALLPAPGTGNHAIEPGTSLYLRGYSGGAQTRWLEATLRRAAAAGDIDWIIVQMHQDALSSSVNGNGCDKGIREEWLPLFDRYGVDLVVCGHDHDYERSFPVRGCNHDAGTDAASGAPVDTLQPRPVVTSDPSDGCFDTSRGTIHLVLGGGGTSAPLDRYGVDVANRKPQAKVFTKPNRPRPDTRPGTFARAGADAVEDAIWSAKRDAESGYGVAVFDVDPQAADGKTTITMNYYHAVGADQAPSANYQLFETVVFAKQRRV